MPPRRDAGLSATSLPNTVMKPTSPEAPAPTPWEIASAADTLRAAGFVIAVQPALQLLTPEETARVLKVHVKWVKCYSKEFPGILRLPGGHLRIPASDLRAFLARGRARNAVTAA